MASTSTAAARMRKEYGEDILHNCNFCCNCQLQKRGEKTKICIGYSSEVHWDPMERACGLWNIPFRGLCPPTLPYLDRIKEEEEEKERKRAIKEGTFHDPMQIGMFG